jgi:peptidoglycan/xylan/chitin deacetylase (PgdA/CDA1 family)
MRRIGLIALAAVLLWVLVSFGYLGPPIFENVPALPPSTSGEKHIALSFDDGPNPPFTEELLDVLEAEGVSATFFMTGQHVVAHPETARRVLAAGHPIGNHGFSEERLAGMSPTRVRESLDLTDRALRKIGVSGPIDVRAAGLAVGYPGAWVYRRTGRRHIGGTASGADWTREPIEPTPPCPFWFPADSCPTQDPDLITDRVLAGVAPGGIIVLHDGHDAFDGADRAGTVEATQRVISRLKAEGYRFVTVQEALRR